MENEAYRELKQRIKDSADPFAYAIGLVNDQRKREVEAARVGVEGYPKPFDKEAFKFLANFPAHELDIILKGHPGYELWKSISSYKVIRNIFEVSKADLIAAIETHGINQQSVIPNRNQLEFYTNTVRKEFFAFTAVAQSLVDYSRIVHRGSQIQDYQDKFNLFFIDIGLHELVVEIRNIFLHGKPILPNWFWTRDFLTGENKYGFTIDKKIMRSILQNQQNRIGREKFLKIQTYLDKQRQNELDLLAILKSYSTMVTSFHKWYIEALRTHNPLHWLDCEKCVHKSNRNMKLLMMRAFSKQQAKT